MTRSEDALAGAKSYEGKGSGGKRDRRARFVRRQIKGTETDMDQKGEEKETVTT